MTTTDTTAPSISMRAFFELDRVRELLEIQKANPYASYLHHWAFRELQKLAKSYGAETFLGEY